MKIAILDLGTNTFHLLIAEVKRGKFKVIFKSKIVVKLVEGSIQKNVIAKVPFRRGIDALLHYSDVIDTYKPKEVHAFATSAIRSSDNGNEFVRMAKKSSGIKINVITGAKEAGLIYYGVRQCVNLNGGTSLIMDIGGGSTEFIIAGEKKVYWKQSFNIGAARLLEMFKPSDPITPNEILAIEAHLKKQLAPLAVAIKKYPVKKLIGSSGSFDTFAEMSGHRFYNRNVIKKVKSYKFKMDDFYRMHDIIIGSTVEERLKMKGLIKMRVDMIVIAAICTNYILKKFNLEEMHLSKYALKEGALWDIMNRKKKL